MSDPLPDNHLALIEQALQRHVAPAATVEALTVWPDGPQGFSSAHLVYYDVVFSHDGATAARRLIVKEMPLLERRVVARLAAAAAPLMPFCLVDDVASDENRPVVLQYVAHDGDQHDPAIQAAVARDLAAIHAANMGRAAALPWLPATDADYFTGYIFAIGDEMWARAAEEPEFQALFAAQRPQLEAAQQRLLADMAALHRTGSTITLIHADLHDQNVLVEAGQPYLIDWGEARYGPFYLDLPNYFADPAIAVYRQALAELGYAFDDAAFQQGLALARRFLGFRYLPFALWQWGEGVPDRASHVQWMLDRALG